MTQSETDSESDNRRETNRLLTRFLNSGINISPQALDFLTSLKIKITPQDLSKVIDRIAYSPNFISHISFYMFDTLCVK